ncbi:hypothetical protein BOTBODRAFT_107539 [Botryobasidium botryosum FD-172 SS1]|uniref:Winged helix-turn helix domain-containing protein n=1 Tax=Botryobasidium botryosum (strain FD-172 SS1) TaxID=930990 RepID=A0A067MWY2_BOTB1|nr:hypothetical protein BOTBODRAFT_107539 [Botryobasidium botryosum FD-172 SS1]
MKHTKTISVTTARWWFHKMGYRWKRDHKGQYVDGHEREDVTAYCNCVFLPAMAAIELRTRKWGINDEPGSSFIMCHTVVWYHDKSTFYAHD